MYVGYDVISQAAVGLIDESFVRKVSLNELSYAA